MLRCSMKSTLSLALQLDLEDVLGHLHYARRRDDLGQLALLTYWDVRKWARRARKDALARSASDLFTHQPYPSRAAFLEKVDSVISELECIHAQADGHCPSMR